MRKFLQLIAVTVCVSVASCCSVTCFSHGVRSRFLSESTAGHLWLGNDDRRAYNFRQLTYYCFS